MSTIFDLPKDMEMAHPEKEHLADRPPNSPTSLTGSDHTPKPVQKGLTDEELVHQLLERFGGMLFKAGEKSNLSPKKKDAQTGGWGLCLGE